MRTRGVFVDPGARATDLIERKSERDLSPPRGIGVLYPGKVDCSCDETCRRVREDAGNDCDRLNIDGERSKPKGVTRDEVKHDHHGVEDDAGCEDAPTTSKTRSTCPGLPKSLSTARDKEPTIQ